jgi:hypothetical protein
MTNQKPYQDAVATIYGWAHHITGELLVSRKGLENPVLDYKPNCPFKQKIVEEVIKEPIITEETKVESELVEETIVEIEEPKEIVWSNDPNNNVVPSSMPSLEQTVANHEDTSRAVKRSRVK